MVDGKGELTPKNDIIFKRLFGKKGNEEIVKDFLEAVLDIKIESVEIEADAEIMPEKLREKIGVLDVRAVLQNGIKIDIEMQNVDYGNIEKRITYYLSQLYTGELMRGKTYNELNKAIAIGILDFEYDKFKDIKEYHTVWNMREKNNLNQIIDEQEIHFIELPKFLKTKFDTDKKLDQWLLFIDYSREELLRVVGEKNAKIKEASEKCEYLTGDAEVQRLNFLKRKYELDYNSGMEAAEKRGEKRGEERGEKRGERRGKKIGEKIGIEKGIRINQMEIIKKLKKIGLDINKIIEVTNLSKEEIEKI